MGNPLPLCLFSSRMLEQFSTHNFLHEYGIGSFVIDPYGNIRANYTNPRTFGNIRDSEISSLLRKIHEECDYWNTLQDKCSTCINLFRCGGMLKESSDFAVTHLYNADKVENEN